jgi:hypothetical protein
MVVRKIDFPNNGGSEPDGDVPRVETGAVQFGNDWPGLFVRGDEAVHLAWCIEKLEPHIKALLEKQRMLVLGKFDHDHLDRAMSALSEFRRTIYEEVIVR